MIVIAISECSQIENKNVRRRSTRYQSTNKKQDDLYEPETTKLSDSTETSKDDSSK